MIGDSYPHSVGHELLSYHTNNVELNHTEEQKEDNESVQYRFDNTLVGSIAQLLRMTKYI